MGKLNFCKVTGYPNTPAITWQEFWANGESPEEMVSRARLHGYYPTVEEAAKAALEISADEKAWRQQWEERVRSLCSDYNSEEAKNGN